jgi:hypothetical protein
VKKMCLQLQPHSHSLLTMTMTTRPELTITRHTVPGHLLPLVRRRRRPAMAGEFCFFSKGPGGACAP